MPTVEEIIKDQVRLEVSCVDRMYLNGYIPKLMHAGQLVDFLVRHRGYQIPSPAMLEKIGKDFVRRVESYAKEHKIPVIRFEKGVRKEDVATRYRRRFKKQEGVVFIGVAQEKAKSFRAKKQCRGKWVHFEYTRQSVFVNHYYFYIQDRQFGPMFIKVCWYAPWTMKLCLNGHEWAKCQAKRQGLKFESLDNGFLSCSEPDWLKRICRGLDAGRIEVMWNRWLRELPLPLGPKDFRAGYKPRLSIWQMEVSLTQVFQRPVQGRQFFEQVIRENLDLGRPDRVQLVFGRRINRRTPSRYRTRVIQHGVAPTIHIEYKHSDVKQYYKEGRALRTETTVNDTHDFRVNRGLKNFAKLRRLGEQINRRLLRSQQLQSGYPFAEEALQDLIRPTQTPQGQPAPALKFGDRRVMAVFSALGSFIHLVDGFTNATLRPSVAALLGMEPEQFRASQMTYDLRRLASKGLIRRLERKNRYVVTESGRRRMCTLLKVYDFLLRPTFPAWSAKHVPQPYRNVLTEALEALDRGYEEVAKAAYLKVA